ncbi:hypothetical protein MW887_010342 [Aspergillus wentii]|nr:hypothetical protein MW887_010342 [Aspergillus wentii]
MISDTHTCSPNPPTNTSNAYRYPLPKADVLLHAGDLTKVGYKAEHEQMVAMLKDADAELKIVIPGNHDITLDEDYYTRLGHLRHHRRIDHTAPSAATRWTEPDPTQSEDIHAIKAMYTDSAARDAGIRYMEEDIETFTLSNGAQFTIYASAYQPEFCQWAFAYDRSIDRFNMPDHPSSFSSFTPSTPVPDNRRIDIMLTHGPPHGILDRVVPSGDNVGCEHLLKASARARPKLHVFGHIHEGYGARRMDWSTLDCSAIRCDPETVLEDRCAYYDVSSEGARPLKPCKETLFVNASVVDIKYNPINAPWLVDLDLPVAGAS